MPGILPMKVIRVGANAQARIAQACDRCRSKKIRCDGIRPCCSQCANVGFECKTSDKLSRRAFPRGYTESLEERVRALEAEVRELKDLLDEKDEKIDMLSRMHSHAPLTSASPRRLSATLSPQSVVESKEEIQQAKDDLFKVQQSPFLHASRGGDSFFMGTSSGRAFIDSFQRRLQEAGKPCSEFQIETFVQPKGTENSTRLNLGQQVAWKAPPRLVSDQMVNVFFQEWAPLFPVLHRPTFLALYEEYVASPDAVHDKSSLAQLHLVFGIAALSHNAQSVEDIVSFEEQWLAALGTVLMENTLSTLQCLVLAQIYCIQKGDYDRVVIYKGLAIGLAQRLGLHQPQKRFALGTLTSETRKKVFWSLYALDCFSAAILGLPKQLKEEEIHCEYPADADDEYVTEKGFLPSLPGESTKLSSGLALFRVSRILARVMEENYPAAASSELSLRKLSALADELDEWSNTLPSHLKLVFAQDKPSTNITGNRSPLLSLSYHYIRTLIHRPAVCANLGDKSSSSVIALAASSKHIIQIVQLLEERNLSFSFCLNKNELITLAGFGLLFQGLDLDDDGKLIRDNQRLLGCAIDLLERSSALGAQEFRRIGSSLMSIGRGPKTPLRPSLSRHNSEGSIATGRNNANSPHNRLAPGIPRSDPSLKTASVKEPRRATVPAISPLGAGSRRTQAPPTTSPLEHIAQARSEPALSPSHYRSSVPKPIRPKRPSEVAQYLPTSVPNLDYLSFESPSVPSIKISHSVLSPSSLVEPPLKLETSSLTDWERLLGSIDNGQTNIYDNIYGGPPVEGLVRSYLPSNHSRTSAFSPRQIAEISNQLSMTDASNLGFDNGSATWPTDIWQYANCLNVPGLPTAQSALSLSDESLTSGEEFSSDGSGSANGSSAFNAFRGIMMPCLTPQDEMEPIDDEGLGLEGVFAL